MTPEEKKRLMRMTKQALSPRPSTAKEKLMAEEHKKRKAQDRENLVRYEAEKTAAKRDMPKAYANKKVDRVRQEMEDAFSFGLTKKMRVKKKTGESGGHGF